MSPRVLLASILALVFPASGLFAKPPAAGLRDAYADKFLIGAALPRETVSGRNPEAAALTAREFSAITAENDMKWSSIHPEPDRYDFKAADDYAAFAKRHGMALIGHTLVWHQQTPAWVFEGTKGGPATREQLIGRMREHIRAVAGRYRGRVKGWDVVNEAISDGPEGLRDSPWRKIIGDDFIDLAFRFAREADPRAELYYNDYGLANAAKRKRAITMLRGLLARGVPIDGVGLQGHYGLSHPSIAEVEAEITDIAALGLKVMITELDVDMLPSRGEAGMADISRSEAYETALNPYANGLTQDAQNRLTERYAALFGVFLKHSDHISRVTFWGLHDGQSWLNNFPVRGRVNHPLLFDRNLRPKPAYSAVIAAAAAKSRR